MTALCAASADSAPSRRRAGGGGGEAHYPGSQHHLHILNPGTWLLVWGVPRSSHSHRKGCCCCWLGTVVMTHPSTRPASAGDCTLEETYFRGPASARVTWPRPRPRPGPGCRPGAGGRVRELARLGHWRNFGQIAEIISHDELLVRPRLCTVDVKLWRCPPFASWIRSRINCRTQNLSWKWINLSNF